MVDYDFKKIEEKWQEEWRKERLFEPEVDTAQKKIFISVPIPYPSGQLHLGHMYTWGRADVYARFMRMRGYNVLFPQAFHFTGGPIMGLRDLVKRGDQKTLDRLRAQGVSEEDIKKFGEDAKYICQYFSKKAMDDLTSAGMSIDWRRRFFTTQLNPYYSKFIEWQFRKLKDLGVVYKGTHPVVWCPNEKTPIGDHDRSEGEGESPVRYTIIKFTIGNVILPAATLRPETVYGATNLWINLKGEYLKLDVNGEEWIVVKSAKEKLESQLKNVKDLGYFDVSEILNKTVRNPVTNEEIPVFSADFVDMKMGTGVVMSVPMHAPFDLDALDRLVQENLSSIKPIRVVNVAGEDNLVEASIKKFGKTKEGLEKATRFVYKEELNKGVMAENCGDISGLRVAEGREKIEGVLTEINANDSIYEITGRVVCRCGYEGIVKVVENQWFLKYSDLSWKELGRKMIERMNIYPEELKTQFLAVIDWLDDKAATRNGGLGTPLPWDESQVVEPLSDSTVYMAYYTIAHLIENIPVEDINDQLFEHVFFGKETNDRKHEKIIKRMRDEFEYWYPLDMRITAKEHITNHLPFFIMNHAILFPESKWPRAIAVNGWLTINMEKLSKSKHAALTIEKHVREYGADRLRLVVGAGEKIDDANWSTDNINGLDQRIGFLMQTAEMLGTFGDEIKMIDEYLKSALNNIIQKTTENYESLNLRTGLFYALYESITSIKLYLDLGGRNKENVRWAIETVTKLIHPAFPYITEEIYSRLGHKGLIEKEDWPAVDKEAVSEAVESEIAILEKTTGDIRKIIAMLRKKGNKPKEIILTIADKNAFEVYNKIADIAAEIKDPNKIRERLGIKGALVESLTSKVNRLPNRTLYAEEEYRVFSESKEWLEKTFGCKVEIKKGGDDKATPGKPAIKII